MQALKKETASVNDERLERDAAEGSRITTENNMRDADNREPAFERRVHTSKGARDRSRG